MNCWKRIGAGIAALLLLPLAAHSAGARGANASLVGTWAGQLPAAQGQTASTTLTFRADGTETQVITGPGGTVTLLTRYATQNGALTEQLLRADSNGHPTQADPRPVTMNYKVSGDMLALSRLGSPQQLLLHRVKRRR